MIARLLLVLLAGVVGWLFGQPPGRAHRAEKPVDEPATNAADPGPGGTPMAETAPASSAVQSATPEHVSPPEDNVSHTRPQARAPWLAAVAAGSLPVLGALGVLVTVALGIGAVRGELPLVGTVADASPAWAAALVTISLWAVYLLWKVPQWQAASWAGAGNANPRELFEIENDSRGTLGQILSGVAVLTGLIFAWQQLGQTSDNLRVSQEGQITDRFTRAVDQLGSDELTVRLGGIYALERIARDSPRDYGPVMEVLTAFARQASPLPAGAAATPAASAPAVPLDVRAVFKVIGRRTPAQVAGELAEGGCLDLTGINAVGADLAGYNLRHTCWDRSDLRGAIAARADLSDSTFIGSTLRQANLDSVTATGSNFTQADLALANLSAAELADANLLAANLSSATLQGTVLSGADILSTNLQNALLLGADLSGADVLNADFTGATISGATLTGAQHLTAEQIDPALVDSATTLPDGIAVTPDF